MPELESIDIEQIGGLRGDLRCTVGESPAWSALENAWYWVDIPAKRIWRLDAGTRPR
jgi:sugar lactone lactonase YvrE